MSTKKPSHEEDEYFAKEDAARRHALAVEKKRQIAAAEQERLKKLHYMKCPKCGFELETIQYKGLAIDKCFHCNGTWLDAGELEALGGKESHVLQSIISVFRPGK
jgi:uncharacterized protein